MSADEARARIPEAAREHTSKGAEAYFRFYFDQLNAAFADPHRAAVHGLSATVCASCRSLEEGVLGLRERGQHVTPEPYRLGEAAELPESTELDVAFQFTLTEVASKIVDGSGATVDDQPKKAHLLEVLLHRVDDGWQVQDLAFAPAHKR